MDTMQTIYLLESVPFLKHESTRHYINGKRVTEHAFCVMLLKHRAGYAVRPDYVEHTVNRNTRNHWALDLALQGAV